MAPFPPLPMGRKSQRSSKRPRRFIVRKHLSLRALPDPGTPLPRPEGAFYLFPDSEAHRETLADRGIANGAALAEALLRDAGVATLPGVTPMAAESLTLRVASVDYDGAEVLERFGKGTASDDLFPAWSPAPMPSRLF